MSRKSKSRLPSLGPAFLALGAMAAIVFLGLARLNVHIAGPQDISIPVRGQGKTAIVIAVSRGGSPGIFELHMKQGTGAEFTLPSSWPLHEVRGMNLRGITASAPTLSGRTWKVTQRGTASFWVGDQPRSLQVRNTGTTPLAVTVRQIFVRENRVDEQEYLITKRPLQIW